MGKLVKQFVDGLEESSVYFLEDEESTSTKKQSARERSHVISCNLIKLEKLRPTKKVWDRYLKSEITKFNLFLMIKVDGYCFLKYLPAILKAPKKNQTSIGLIAIGICYLI